MGVKVRGNCSNPFLQQNCTYTCTKLVVTLWCASALQARSSIASIIVACCLYALEYVVQCCKWHVMVVQVRYQKGIQTMLDQWVNKKPFEEDNYIVREGKLAGQYS